MELFREPKHYSAFSYRIERKISFIILSVINGVSSGCIHTFSQIPTWIIYIQEASHLFTKALFLVSLALIFKTIFLFYILWYLLCIIFKCLVINYLISSSCTQKGLHCDAVINRLFITRDGKKSISRNIYILIHLGNIGLWNVKKYFRNFLLP